MRSKCQSHYEQITKYEQHVLPQTICLLWVTGIRWYVKERAKQTLTKPSCMAPTYRTRQWSISKLVGGTYRSESTTCICCNSHLIYFSLSFMNLLVLVTDNISLNWLNRNKTTGIFVLAHETLWLNCICSRIWQVWIIKHMTSWVMFCIAL